MNVNILSLIKVMLEHISFLACECCSKVSLLFIIVYLFILRRWFLFMNVTAESLVRNMSN